MLRRLLLPLLGAALLALTLPGCIIDGPGGGHHWHHHHYHHW